MDIGTLGQYFLNPHVMIKALPALLSGVVVLLKVSSGILGFGFVVGLALAVLRTTPIRYIGKPVNAIIRVYVDVLRASPVLVLLVVIYYGGPFLGINLSDFWATVVTFGACLSAFAEEIFRAGIEAINKGQIEAARALGLTHLQTMRHVILPWALVVTIPTLTNRTIAIIKDVSMASAIALPELMKQARHLNSLFANPTPLIEAAIIYVALFFPLVRVTLFLEKRIGQKAI